MLLTVLLLAFLACSVLCTDATASRFTASSLFAVKALSYACKNNKIMTFIYTNALLYPWTIRKFNLFQSWCSYAFIMLATILSLIVANIHQILPKHDYVYWPRTSMSMPTTLKGTDTSFARVHKKNDLLTIDVDYVWIVVMSSLGCIGYHYIQQKNAALLSK